MSEIGCANGGIPATDEDLIRRQEELNDALRRLVRRERYPAYWDWRNPRSAEEYLENNRKRRRNQSRRLTVFVERLLCGSVLFFLWAVALALLVG